MASEYISRQIPNLHLPTEQKSVNSDHDLRIGYKSVLSELRLPHNVLPHRPSPGMEATAESSLFLYKGALGIPDIYHMPE